MVKAQIPELGVNNRRSPEGGETAYLGITIVIYWAA
jgi:hypothetical protein